MKANYTEPKLCPENRDMAKTWFVYFRFTNPLTGERVPVKYKAGLNYITDKKERIKEGLSLEKYLTSKLADGWNPLSKETFKEDEQKTLIEHINDVLATKKPPILKKKSYHKYDKMANLLIDWMSQKKLKNLYPQNYTNVMARKFMEYIITDKNYCGKSHNNVLSIIKAIFSPLVTKEIINKNPFVGIKELREEQGKNFPFTDTELVELKSYMNEHCPHFFAMCCFTYYCFLRRTELIEIKVGDIDLKNMTIRIHSAGSKNSKQQMVTIPRAMEPIVKNMQLEKYPSTFYVFGRGMKTCDLKVQKPDYISTKFRKIADGLNIDKNKGYYAFKHTGACALFNATKDPYIVMSQARHSDINITMIYLRSLGVTVSEKIRYAEFSM